MHCSFNYELVLHILSARPQRTYYLTFANVSIMTRIDKDYLKHYSRKTSNATDQLKPEK